MAALSAFLLRSLHLALFAKGQGREEWFCWYVTGAALRSPLVYWRLGESQPSAPIADEEGVARTL